ncbi:hypothetical protein NPIL_620561 [Nephila pilipes]|uniref:Uncharacterized protein n=1 Tax=Nephila pilipes TaxID=299642 RepID=A0A8X6MPU9_NEPPI|nr:hypothetical protein NPIL_620561 [Nephila pilipes]
MKNAITVKNSHGLASLFDLQGIEVRDFENFGRMKEKFADFLKPLVELYLPKMFHELKKGVEFQKIMMLSIRNPIANASKMKEFEEQLNEFHLKFRIISNYKYETELPWKLDSTNLTGKGRVSFETPRENYDVDTELISDYSE